MSQYAPWGIISPCYVHAQQMVASSILKTEQDRQQEYVLTGDLDPEHLFKESQSVKEADGYEDETLQKLTMPILNELNTIHKMRNVPSQKGILSDLEEALPNGSNEVGQRFWAVLIGNNKYSDAEELYGCINDTKLICDYLLDHLGVPNNRIRLLHDASREAIIDALYDLRDNHEIQIRDNILIHFSGHGSIYEAKSFVETGVSPVESIGAICPSDRSGDIPDISYRELNLILSEVRETKGDNITFITDCCYSGGMAGANLNFNELSMVPIRLRMLESAERDPRRKSSILGSSEDWKGDVSSFVHLAACQEVQKAREMALPNGCKYGTFTWALVKALKRTSPGRTYTDIIQRIGPLNRNQVPTVVGVRKESRLWFQ